jgi:hypothetical protein
VLSIGPVCAKFVCAYIEALYCCLVNADLLTCNKISRRQFRAAAMSCLRSAARHSYSIFLYTSMEIYRKRDLASPHFVIQISYDAAGAARAHLVAMAKLAKTSALESRCLRIFLQPFRTPMALKY